MKRGLILEGGALRGIFSAGAMDVLMEANIPFDGVIGVSAGACFGCNYKSHQPGRVLRYNLQYLKDPRYCGVGSWLRSGNFFNTEFCYHELPDRLDPFDVESFNRSPMEFIVVCTDIHTGEPVYFSCREFQAEMLKWIQASAAMPVLAQVVEVAGKKLLDGGIADSIPLAHMLKRGYNKNIVILTRPPNYRKAPIPGGKLLKLALGKYPALAQALQQRHLLYNRQQEEVQAAVAKGQAIVIQPPAALPIGHFTTDPEAIKRTYQIGRQAALHALPQIQEYLQE